MLAGTPPAAARLRVDADCVRLGVADVPDDSVVSESGGLGNVFVYLKDAPDTTLERQPQPAVLAVRGCRFEPHVLGVRVGQPLAIVNEDGTLQNVHARPMRNLPFNIGQPLAGMTNANVDDASSGATGRREC